MKVVHIVPHGWGGVQFVAERICSELLALGVECKTMTFGDFLRGGTTVSADIFHVHSAHHHYAPFILRKVRKLGRVVFTPHYHGRPSTLLYLPFFKVIVKLLRREVRREVTVHSVSSYEASLIKRDFGIEPIVIEHGVDVHSQNIEKSNILVYAGRLVRYKRVDKVILLGEELKKLNAIEKVFIVGKGNDLPRLRRVAKSVSVDVIFHDVLPHEEYLKLLSKARFAANFSEMEAFSIFSAEALASRAVVAVNPPWGRIFSRCPNAVLAHESLAATAKEMLRRSNVPCAFQSWREVAKKYLDLLYAR
jgi:glycosyltransferase involved in cell wall biosynthesis